MPRSEPMGAKRSLSTDTTKPHGMVVSVPFRAVLTMDMSKLQVRWSPLGSLQSPAIPPNDARNARALALQGDPRLVHVLCVAAHHFPESFAVIFGRPGPWPAGVPLGSLRSVPSGPAAPPCAPP